MYVDITVLIINFLYFVIELIGGFYFNSIALKADAFHMLTDILAISISIYCEYLYKLKKNSKTTFGWKRSKILGGFTNTVFLLSTCVFLFIEAVTKFFEHNDIHNLQKNVDIFIIISVIGLIVNFVSMLLYAYCGSGSGHGHGHGHTDNEDDFYEDSHQLSMNTKALLLHFIGDTLGSIVVIIAGILIKYDNNSNLTSLYDPICSFIIIFIIIIPAIKLYKKSFKILLQYIPSTINSEKLKQEIIDLNFVIGIHELHIWQLDEKIIIGTIHYSCNNYNNIEEKCIQIKNLFHKYGIHSTTVQPELANICNEPSCKNDCNSKKCCTIEIMNV